MDEWEIQVRVWPHSTGNGREKDQNAVGDENRIFTVKANDFSAAYQRAKDIATGIQSHPMVWEVPIVGIRQKERF